MADRKDESDSDESTMAMQVQLETVLIETLQPLANAQRELEEVHEMLPSAIYSAVHFSIQLTKWSLERLVENESTLRDELRQCIDDVAEEYAEFHAEEFKKRADAVFDRQSRQIDTLSAKFEKDFRELAEDVDENLRRHGR